MTVYTVIAYRPDHEDYCMGCRMGGSSSELEIGTFQQPDGAAEFIAKKEWADSVRSLEEGEWECTILIDGFPEEDAAIPEDAFTQHAAAVEEVRKLVPGHLNQLKEKAEEEKRERIEKDKKQKRAEKAKRERDKARREREEYERLKTKFEKEAQ